MDATGMTTDSAARVRISILRIATGPMLTIKKIMRSNRVILTII